MFWRLVKPKLTISAELHRKIARQCCPINGIPSEVITMRTRKELASGSALKKGSKKSKPQA